MSQTPPPTGPSRTPRRGGPRWPLPAASGASRDARLVPRVPGARLQRAATWIAFVLGAAAVLVPTGLVVEGPGPAVNTVGDLDGKPVLTITGAKTYPTSSQLDLTTVSVAGGPGRAVAPVAALAAWVNPHEDVQPAELFYPLGTTREESDLEGAQEMTGAQDLALGAALKELDIPYRTQTKIVGLANDSNKGVLKKGDIVLSAAGTPISEPQTLVDAVRSKYRGKKTMPLVVRRDGKTVHVDARVLPTQLAPHSGPTPSLGVYIAIAYSAHVKAQFKVGDIGGPSAGTMMALGIVDRLTPGSLAGDKHVAGTGTISPDGTVGPIGGIPQKVVGAQEKGATIFLAPAANCAELKGRVPDGITAYSISRLHQARELLEQIGRGEEPRGVQTCG